MHGMHGKQRTSPMTFISSNLEVKVLARCVTYFPYRVMKAWRLLGGG